MSSVLYDLHLCMPFPNITCRQLARTSIYTCAWWSFFWRSVHDSHDNLLQEYCKRCPEVTTNPFGTYSLLGLYDWNFSNIIVPLHGLPRLIYIGLFFSLTLFQYSDITKTVSVRLLRSSMLHLCVHFLYIITMQFARTNIREDGHCPEDLEIIVMII
jgi:hypothetical protein